MTLSSTKLCHGNSKAYPISRIPDICRGGQCFIPVLPPFTSDTYLFLVKPNSYPYGLSEYQVWLHSISQKGMMNEDS